MFTIDDTSVFPWGSETILYKGTTVGFVTSAAYGFTLGKGVGMAMLKRTNKFDLIIKYRDTNNDFEIDINGTLFKIQISYNNKPF